MLVANTNDMNREQTWLITETLQILAKVTLNESIIYELENKVGDEFVANAFDLVHSAIAFCFRRMFARAFVVLAGDDAVTNLTAGGIVLKFELIMCLQ